MGLRTYYPDNVPIRFIVTTAALLALTACTVPAPESKRTPVADPNGPGPATATGKHPLAKYVELSGFRLNEGGAGKLKVQFVAINHSEADLGALMVHVKLITSAAKPEDAPVAEFGADIKDLGPLAIRNVEASATTKLRVYELPDWQFLRAQFEILSPAP